MNIREITIGRSKDCDIFLDARCIYASSNHGAIYYDGTQLMYRDTSSNGTMINNVTVWHRAVPIKRGDIIMIAGRYQLNWNQIDKFFHLTTPFRPQGTVSETPVQQALRAANADSTVDTKKWNWGAFGLYGLWGFFNGCWWAFLISMFFGCLFPIPNIIFGVYGTRWAWENKNWSSPQDFIETQSNWAIWGIIVTCLNALFFLWWIIVYAAYIF